MNEKRILRFTQDDNNKKGVSLMKKIFFILVFVFVSALALAEQEVATIHVSPAIANTRYGGEVQFRAYAHDAQGNLIANFKPSEWVASAGIIDENGRYIANIVGYHTVSARYYKNSTTPNPVDPGEFIEGTASVHVGEERPR